MIKDTGQKAKKLLSLEQFVLFDNQQIEKTILAKQAEMKIASRDLDFELAILLRDEIQELEKMGRQGGNSNESTVGYKRNI